MVRSYDKIMAARRARMSLVGLAALAVFEKAYRIAMQVIELREQHGLTPGRTRRTLRRA